MNGGDAAMNDNGFLELLRRRQSCRRFARTAVEEEAIQKLLLAANGAPVGSNRNEDLHITVVTDRAALDELAFAMKRRMEDAAVMQLLTEKLPGGRSAAQRGVDPFYGAPVVFFVSHRVQTLQPGIEFSNVMSVAMAMHLEATALGLGSVFIWGVLEAMRMYPEADRSAVLRLPKDFQPLLGLAAGYPARPAEPRAINPDKFTVNTLS